MPNSLINQFFNGNAIVDYYIVCRMSYLCYLLFNAKALDVYYLSYCTTHDSICIICPWTYATRLYVELIKCFHDLLQIICLSLYFVIMYTSSR